MSRAPHPHPARFKFRLHYGICLFLVLCTLSVFWQVRAFDFVNYDDDLYVFENPFVKEGITRKGLLWSFQTTRGGNWHPLTWLSHMVDTSMHGLDPGRHHLTSVFFHILNTLLVFLLFRRMTGQDWQSTLLALLFAIHPTRVESVAWVAERKDVLSVFLALLTVGAYGFYTVQQNRKRYAAVLLLFVLGLMAKPMLVSLPLVLLLLDIWPLRRFAIEKTAGLRKEETPIMSLLGEKLPLFFAVFVINAFLSLFALISFSSSYVSIKTPQL